MVQSRATTDSYGWITTGNSTILIGDSTINVNKEGIHPTLYFKFVKKKFTKLQQFKIERRIKKIEKAFDNAVKNGQEVLAEKFLNTLSVSLKEAMAYSKGCRFKVKKDDISKHKHNISGGHISDTLFEEYTRIIPDNVIKEKVKYNDIFNGYTIYHYYNVNVEKESEFTKEEREKMKDPVLFGWFNENKNEYLYYITDWEDEYCTLKFEDIIDVLSDDSIENV